MIDEKQCAPVGIFDSGLGGLSVWSAVTELLPHESIVYFGDSANCPYGEKGPQEIIDLSVKATDFLLSKGAKLVVVACNTATTAAISHLRGNYDLPFVGIEPAVKPAALCTRTKRIGLLATKGTIESDFFNNTKERYAQGVKVISRAGDGLVDLVEAGRTDGPETEKLLRSYLGPMVAENIDVLILGCTHYPFLIPVIKKIVGDAIEIIQPAPAVAKRVESLLGEFNLACTDEARGEYSFYSSGDPDQMARFLTEHLISGPAVHSFIESTPR